MENDLEEKQNFLRVNIVDKGYDTDEFTEFLCYKKGGEAGCDLNNWQLIELKLAVKEFMTLYKPKAEEEDNNQGEDNQNDYISNKEYSEAPKVSRMNNESYFDTAICKISGETDLSKQDNVIIQLSFPERTEGSGLFAKSYVTYLVTTMPFGYKVRKRYSDFEWLKKILQKLYLGSVIPAIPRKNYQDQFKEAFISKRMRNLEKFMQTLTLDPLIKNSEILFEFLTIENEAEFIAKKIEYNNKLAPVHLNDITSMKGEINISISNDEENAFQVIKEDSIIKEKLLRDVSKGYKVLCEKMLGVSQQMKDIGRIWEQLHEVSLNAQDGLNVTDTYKVLSKLMNDWSDTKKKESQLLSIDIREYFKFIKNEYKSLGGVVAKVDLYRSAYYNEEDRVLQKKDSLFKSQDIGKWELDPNDLDNKKDIYSDRTKAFQKMLPRETKRVIELKQFYGFYLNKIISEHKRLKNINLIRHKSNMVIYAQSHSCIISEMHVGIADLVAYFNEF